MTNNRTSELEYQFTAMPTNLFLCLDNNCRSMLFTLIQLSTYYAKEDGFFFRTNEDLKAESNLSENLVRATLSSLYDNGLIIVSSVGKSKGTTPNYFKVNFESFIKWESLSIEECMKNPMYKIETADYRHKGFTPSYLNGEAKRDNHQQEIVSTPEIVKENVIAPTQTNSQTIMEVAKKVLREHSKSEHNINNIENENNTSKNSTATNEKSGSNGMSKTFDEYKAQEDHLMNKLYGAKNYTDYDLYSKELMRLISQCTHEGWVARTRKRYEKIKTGKEKFFAALYSKEKQNPIVEDENQSTSLIEVKTVEKPQYKSFNDEWAAMCEKAFSDPEPSEKEMKENPSQSLSEDEDLPF